MMFADGKGASRVKERGYLELLLCYTEMLLTHG